MASRLAGESLSEKTLDEPHPLVFDYRCLPLDFTNDIEMCLYDYLSEEAVRRRLVDGEEAFFGVPSDQKGDVFLVFGFKDLDPAAYRFKPDQYIGFRNTVSFKAAMINYMLRWRDENGTRFSFEKEHTFHFQDDYQE